MESLNTKLQDKIEQIEQTKKDAEDSIRTFRYSQENKAHVLGVYIYIYYIGLRECYMGILSSFGFLFARV